MNNLINTLGVFGYKKITIGPISIAYYALCILSGALLAYYLSRHYLKKQGYKPEELETVFYFAFPAGIVGARIWYVIADWKNFFATHTWYESFFMWQGGLAIQGGVILGAAVGIYVVVKYRPHWNIFKVVDCVVPTILLAQAIGRWGNFINQEVYGQCVSTWEWLPNFIKDRLTMRLTDFGFGSNPSYLCGGPDKMITPLFLVEGTINVIGYFLIRYGVKPLYNWIGKLSNGKFKYVDADLMWAYFIWYGVVRAFLEPLRNASYNMGDWSAIYMAVAFVVFGLIGMALTRTGVLKVKKDEQN